MAVSLPFISTFISTGLSARWALAMTTTAVLTASGTVLKPLKPQKQATGAQLGLVDAAAILNYVQGKSFGKPRVRLSNSFAIYSTESSMTWDRPSTYASSQPIKLRN